jgi:hypothetical protein
MIFTAVDTYTIITCCKCHCTFGMSSGVYNSRKKDGEIFYCPMGHSQHFTESDDVKHKRELTELSNRLANKEVELIMSRNAHSSSERKLKAIKTKLKKTETRISKGVCPYCNRQFLDLYKHMAGQHPEYKEKK